MFLNSNLAYQEIFNYGNLIIYKNGLNDIRYNCQSAPWNSGFVANTAVAFKSNAGIAGLTGLSQLILPVRITNTGFAVIGSGYFIVKPTEITFIPLITTSSAVYLYGCNYAI